MYSYEERMKAVRLYVEYNHSGAAAVRKLGYPTRRTLREWHKEYVESGDLHAKYPKRAKYSDEQKREAVEYYLLHGRSISGTIRALGYPCRETLREWIDELFPGLRSVAIRSGRGVPFSEEQKRAAVIELCSRDGSASSIADAFGVSRVGLYKWKHELLGHKERASMKVPDKQSSSDDRDELAREVERLRKRIYRLQLEHDILKEANELLKKDEGINPQILTNREKTLLIDALKPSERGIRCQTFWDRSGWRRVPTSITVHDCSGQTNTASFAGTSNRYSTRTAAATDIGVSMLCSGAREDPSRRKSSDGS